MTNKEQFKLYLENSGSIADSSIKKYVPCVGGQLTKCIKDSSENINSVYDITDVRRLKSLLDSLMNVHAFAEQNSSGNNMYTAAFNRYIEYCQSLLEKHQDSNGDISEAERTINEDNDTEYNNDETTKSPDFHLSAKQIIFYGAPGTGKSHTIKEMEDDIQNPLTCIRTTFHPDSDYATFVGCYKPHRVKDGKRQGEITYEFVEQAFLEAYKIAWKNPEKDYALIIEEINRGNCAQVFGDIFQLLDREDDGWSTYPIKADTDIEDHLSESEITGYSEKMVKRYGKDKEGYGYLALPPNLSILATMNTSDQSLFPMDSAFKRRWDWKYIPIDQGKDDKGNPLNWKIETTASDNSWWHFLQSINTIIASVTKSEDKELGFFFCKANPGTNLISAEKFVNKVVFYLWSDVFKTYGFRSDIFNKDKDGKAKLTFRDFYTKDSKPNETVIALFINNVIKYLPKEVADDDVVEISNEGNTPE